MSSTPTPADADALVEGQTRVKRLAQSLVRDYDRAEDVTQEAALRALTGSGKPKAGLSAYLAGIARNVAAKFHRSDRRREAREERSARPEAEPSTLELLERVDLQRTVLERVKALGEPYRTAVLLRFIEGLPPREIAKRQDVPVETVKSRIKRGLAMLRDDLDRVHGGNRRAWLGAILPIAGWPSLATASAVTAHAKGGIVAATSTSNKLAVGVVVLLLIGGAALLATGVIGSADDETETTTTTDGRGDAIGVDPGLEGSTDPLAADAPEDPGAERTPMTGPDVVDIEPEATPPEDQGPFAGSMSHVPPVRRSAFAPPAPKGEFVVNTWARPRFSGGGGGMGPTGHWTRFPEGLPPKGRSTLVVKVLDENGLPIEAAEVMIAPAELAGHEGVSFGDVRKLGLTAANGKYRHEQLTAGEVAVCANVGRIMNGRYGLDTRPAVVVTLRDGGTANAEVRLPLTVKELGHVEGRVTDPNGNPLRATVAYKSNQVYTERDGTYKLLRVPAGPEQAITISRWGYEPNTTALEIRPGGTKKHDVELEFKEAGRITIGGQVVGPDEEPVAGGIVYLNVESDNATFRSARTDADGRWELKDLPERLTKEKVEVQGTGIPRYGSTRIPYEDGVPNGTQVRIQIMERFVDLVLDIRDAATNEPVRRVRASAQALETEEKRRPGSFWYHEEKGGHSGIIQPGRYRVTVEALDHENTEFDLDVPSQDTFTHELTLKRTSPESVDIHLLVELVSGTTENPVATAKIQVLDATGEPLARYEGSREDGRFLLPVPSGKRTLSIEAEGFEPYREAIDFDRTVLEVEHVVHLRPR